MTTTEAVNEILEAAGLSRVTTYTSNDASNAAKAERRLDKACMDILSDGWPATERRWKTVEPILFDFSNAAWTASTRTLTLASTFGNATVGMTIDITDANGGTEGDYVVEEVTSVNAIKLSTSLNATNIAGGIDGVAVTNQIKVPSGTLDIDAEDTGLDLIQIGDHLFDRARQDDGSGGTDQFEDGVEVRVALRYDFECLPYKLQQYIVAAAALEFYDTIGLSKTGMIYQRLIDRRREAKVRAEQHRSDITDINTLRAPHNADFTRVGRVLARDLDAGGGFPASGLSV